MKLLRIIELNFLPYSVDFCHTTKDPMIVVGSRFDSEAQCEGRVNLYNLHDDKPLAELSFGNDNVFFVCASPIAPFVLIGGEFGLRRLDLQNDELTNPLPEFRAMAFSCIPHPFRNLFLIGADYKIWRIEMEQMKFQSLATLSSNPELAPFHPNAEDFYYSYTRATDSSVAFEALVDGELKRKKQWEVPIEYMRVGKFHPQGTHYVLLTDLVRVFTYPDHQQVCAFDAAGEFFEAPWESFLKSRRQVWDGMQWHLMESCAGVPWGDIAFNESGNEIYCVTPIGRVLHINWVEKRVLGSTVVTEKAGLEKTCGMIISRDNNYMVTTGSLDKYFKIWQLDM